MYKNPTIFQTGNPDQLLLSIPPHRGCNSQEEMNTTNFFFLFPAIHAIVECLLPVIFPVILRQIVVRPGNVPVEHTLNNDN